MALFCNDTDLRLKLLIQDAQRLKNNLEKQQKTAQALQQLGEGRRLVGIISHVAGLKERIDRQIIVKKDRSGGSRAEIVC